MGRTDTGRSAHAFRCRSDATDDQSMASRRRDFSSSLRGGALALALAGTAACGGTASSATETVAFVCVELVEVPFAEDEVEEKGAEFYQQYQSTVCTIDVRADEPAPRRLDDRLIAPGQPIAVVGETIVGLNRLTEGEGFEWFAFDGGVRTTSGPPLGTPTRLDDGRLVGSRDGGLAVLDVETRQEVASLSLDVAHVAVDDAAAGRVVVIGDDAEWSDAGRTLIVVDLSGDDPVEVFRRSLEPLATACIDHVGRQIVVATGDSATLVDLEGGEETDLPGFRGLDCAWAPDDSQVVAIDLGLVVLDADSLEVDVLVPGAPLGISPAWLDGDRVVVAGFVGDVSAQDPASDLLLFDLEDGSWQNLTEGFDVGAAFPATDR